MTQLFNTGAFSTAMSATELANRILSRGDRARIFRKGLLLCTADNEEGETFAEVFSEKLFGKGFIIIITDLSEVDGRRSAGKVFENRISNMLSGLPGAVPPVNGRMPTLAKRFKSLGDQTRVDVVLVIVGFDRLKDRGADLEFMKKLKTAIDAVNNGVNRPANTALYVVGIGQDEERLRTMVGNPAEPFFGTAGFRAAG